MFKWVKKLKRIVNNYDTDLLAIDVRLLNLEEMLKNYLQQPQESSQLKYYSDYFIPNKNKY